MSGAYGDFLEAFPELREPCAIWNKEDASDIERIIAVYMPNEGSGLKRRKFTSGNTAHDVTEVDELYVECRYDKNLREGTYVRRLDKPQWIMRLTEDVGYEKAAGYHVFKIERVTGATIDKTEDLKVKEPHFA